MSTTRGHRRLTTASLLLLLCLFVLHASGILAVPLLHRLDEQIQDARLRATMPRTLDERIVIVDIDEKSLAEVGRWPWPRDRVADLVDRLFGHDIRLLGMDTVFAEPDPLPGADQRLAQAIRGRPVVLGYYFTSDREGRITGQLPAPVLDLSDGSASVPLTRWNGYGANLPGLMQAGASAGFFNAITDDDGVVRSLPLLASHGDQVYESLGLALFRQLLDRPSLELDASGADGSTPGVQGIRLTHGDRQIVVPTDGRGALLVPFRGMGGAQGGSFTYLSAADVLADRVPPQALRGRIVLLGTTAPGLQDLRATPVSQVYPGVEVHANLLSGLLDGRLPYRPDYAAGYELLILLVTGLALALWLPRLGATKAVALCLVLMLGVVAVTQFLYLEHGLVLPMAALLALIMLALALHMGLGFLGESRARRELARRFGTYVPPEIVEEMLRDPDRYDMSATTREMTVLFCDMKGFTQLAETMPPADLQRLLNEVFSRLTAVVQRHRGTIDKYMGDCLMAFWGAPVPAEDHATRAVDAALDIVAEVLAINQAHRDRGLPEIGVGVGLSTGPMCVGDMGSDLRRSYTVIGDTVNLGARLEGLSRVYGVDIVASDRTREQAPGHVWQEIDRVRVKGRSQALAVHLPLGPAAVPDEAMQRELSQWRAFRLAWLARDWPACEGLLADLMSVNAKKVLYRYWAERVGLTKTSPPGPHWDGATDHSQK